MLFYQEQFPPGSKQPMSGRRQIIFNRFAFFNDGNGHTDCEDFSCSASDDFAVRQVCQESVFRPYPSDDPVDPVVASCKGSGDPYCDQDRQLQANTACSSNEGL